MIYQATMTAGKRTAKVWLVGKSRMNIETEIFLALGLDRASALRKIAATVAYKYWMEMHRYGDFRAASEPLTKIIKRFRLGDWVCALSAHYPINHRPAK